MRKINIKLPRSEMIEEGKKKKKEETRSYRFYKIS